MNGPAEARHEALLYEPAPLAAEHDPSGRGCAIAGMANTNDYRGLRGGWGPSDVCRGCAEPGAIARAWAAYNAIVEREA